MSTKRILGISAFGVLFIAVAIGLMLLTSNYSRETGSVPLPDPPIASAAPGAPGPDTLDRVEVTSETVQAVISTLARPETYSRYITIESFWGDDGHAVYTVLSAVDKGVTSLRIISSVGAEKRIIVTPDKLYIWYRGDKVPYIGETGSAGDEIRTADEWQMMASYEDIMAIDGKDIEDAGFTGYNGEDCIFVQYRSAVLGYTRMYYISIQYGLVTGAEEYDGNGELVYRMTAGECVTGVIDPSEFILPDGTELITPTIM